MTTKRCNKCEEEKAIDAFPSKGRVCNHCLTIWQREHRRKMREAYLAANPPQPKPVITHKVCTMCGNDKPLEEFNWSSKARSVRSTYCKPCQGKRAYADFLRRSSVNPDEKLRYRCNMFGTTVEWYKERLAEQDGKCALCGREETHPYKKGRPPRKLAIDHDHEKGHVRGLLCFRCNTALYQLELNGLDWAERAVAYLEKYKETSNGDISDSPSV